jgi:hypothetical protein
MQFGLFMGLEIIWSIWLAKNGHVFSIGLNLLTYTPSNQLHLSSMIDTKPCVMTTRNPRPWKKLTFNMLTFDYGGTCLEMLAWVLFKSSTIGSTFGTFVCDNGEASCWM